MAILLTFHKQDLLFWNDVTKVITIIIKKLY